MKVRYTLVGKKNFVTRRPNEQFLPDCLRPKFPKLYFTMIWGAMTDKQVSSMMLWDKEAWGNIISTGFVEYIFPVGDYVNIINFV